MTEQKRPPELTGKTRKVRTGCGNIYITLNFNSEGEPFELFTRLGKAGGCASSQTEAIGRLASLMLRSGLPLSDIITELTSIGCFKQSLLDKSCPDAIASALAKLSPTKKEPS